MGFTAPLALRRKTKFPTVHPPIYLPKWKIWIQLSPNWRFSRYCWRVKTPQVKTPTCQYVPKLVKTSTSTQKSWSKRSCIYRQVLAFQKSWRSFSPIIVCILAHCMLPFWTSRACSCSFILSTDYKHLNCELLPFNTCFQRGCCLIFWKHPAYAWYVMVMYLTCDTFMENHLTTHFP